MWLFKGLFDSYTFLVETATFATEFLPHPSIHAKLAISTDYFCTTFGGAAKKCKSGSCKLVSKK